MPAVMEIVSGHPLHYLSTFWHRLPLGNKKITSIQQGYCYLYLMHHGKADAAEALLHDDQSMWQTHLITRNLLQKSVVHPNINIVLRQVDMMRSIVLHQIEQDSDFAKSLQYELRELGNPAPGKVEFRVYTATQEMILTSGSQFKNWKDPPRGFDFYAKILAEAHAAMVRPQSLHNPRFNIYTSDFEHFLPAQTHSLFLVMDSQGKFIDMIVGGKVTAVSGGNFGHILQVLERGDEWRRHRWVIIYCGTNCRTNSRYQETQVEFQWRNLLDLLAKESDRRGRDGSILFCTSFEHPWVDVAPGVADRVERDLEGTGVQCINWRSVGNPFLDTDGMPIQTLYDNFNRRTAYAKKAEIHLNHEGLSLLWHTWCRYLPDLQYLPIKMSSKPLALPKWLFQEEKPDPQPVDTTGRTLLVNSRIGAGFANSSAHGRSNDQARETARQALVKWLLVLVALALVKWLFQEEKPDPQPVDTTGRTLLVNSRIGAGFANSSAQGRSNDQARSMAKPPRSPGERIR